MIFFAIFTSKYFQTQTRRERERERERERDCKPRNRLRLWLRRTQKPTPLNPENPRLRKPIRQTQKTHSIKPIKPIRQTQKTHSIAPSQTLIAPIAPPARLSHPSIDPPKIDCSRRTPKAIILMLFLLGIENLGFVSFVSFGFWWIWVLSSTQLRHPHSSNPVASLSLSLSLSHNLTRFDEFFLLRFVSFVFIYWEMILIFVWKMRKCEKHDKNGFSRAFSKIQPNTRKYFPKYFLECNKTLENIFLSRK